MKKTIATIGITATLLSWPALAEVRRVVSLSICQDVILTNVADREQVAALSHYSRDMGRSPIGALAQTIPITHESAEEVIALGPDLILASQHSDLATRNALKRLGIQIELFKEPKTIDESLEQVRTIARLVNRESRGDALVAEIEESLRKAAPAPGTRPVKALLFQNNGFSTGSGSLVHEMLTHVGFENMAVRYGLKYWGDIPLEWVVADPPEVLLAGAVEADKPAWADRVRRHPALKDIQDHMMRFTFPERFMDCGGPVLAESATAMAEARDLVLNRGRR